VKSVTRQLDETDRRILDHLRRDGRCTLGDIGEHVGLSAPAIKRRIDAMETAGVIRGYTVLVDPSVLGHTIEAFAELRFVGNAPVGVIESIAADVPEIQALYTVAGDPDAIAYISARDVDDLKRVIDAVRRTGHVTGTKTLIVLGSVTGGDPVRRTSPMRTSAL
jgi:Lrp/AsnC family transcriptional regulator, leucine-responsive regulatory protein